MPSLTALIEDLNASLTLLIGPVGRPSMRLLREALAASPRVTVDERRLSLVCVNADAEGETTGAEAPDADEASDAHGATGRCAGAVREMRSAGVHSLLVVRPAPAVNKH